MRDTFERMIRLIGVPRVYYDNPMRYMIQFSEDMGMLPQVLERCCEIREVETNIPAPYVMAQAMDDVMDLLE